MFLDSQRQHPTKLQPGDIIVIHFGPCSTISCSRLPSDSSYGHDRLYWSDGDDKAIIANYPIAPYIAHGIVDTICGASGLTCVPHHSLLSSDTSLVLIVEERRVRVLVR